MFTLGGFGFGRVKALGLLGASGAEGVGGLNLGIWCRKV